MYGRKEGWLLDNIHFFIPFTQNLEVRVLCFIREPKDFVLERIKIKVFLLLVRKILNHVLMETKFLKFYFGWEFRRF